MLTISQFYNGQRRRLIKELKKRTDLYGANAYFKVFTVDSYQGEENDIVLLSLVRSNNYLSVGFLDNRNRLVVALSRARRGLYIFGNTITLTMAESTEEKCGREPLWDPLINFMKIQGRYDLDGGFPITCAKHENTVRITDPVSWFTNSGGCEEYCDEGPLPCGHPCPLRCHPYEHERVICKQPCPRILSCGHGCSGSCSQNPCHCSMCAIAETADGQPMLQESDVFSALDLEMHKVLYEEDGIESEADSPVKPINNGLVMRSTLIRHNHRPTFAEATRGETSRAFSRRGNRQSGLARDARHLSDSFTSEIARDDSMSPKLSSQINRPAQPSQRSPLRSGPGSSLSPTKRQNGLNKHPFTPVSKRNNSCNNNFSPAFASTPKTWRSWDAKKADDEMNEMRRLEDEMIRTVDRSTLVFHETYRPINVEDGFRKRSSGGVKKSVIHRSEPNIAFSSLNEQVARISNEIKTAAIDDTAIDLIELTDNEMTSPEASSTGAVAQGDPVSMRGGMLLISLFGDADEPEALPARDLQSEHLLDLEAEPSKLVQVERKYFNDLQRLVDLNDGELSDFTKGKAGSSNQSGKPGLTVAEAFAEQNLQRRKLFQTNDKKSLKPSGNFGPRSIPGTLRECDQQRSEVKKNDVVKQSGRNSVDLLDLDEFLAISQQDFHAAPVDLSRPQSTLSLL